MRPGRGLSFLRWKAPCTSSVLTPLSGRAGGRASRTFCRGPHGAQACEQTPPWTLVCVFRKRALLVGFSGWSAPRETTERPGPVPRGPPASLLRGRQWVCDTLPPGPRFATQERNALLLYNGRFNEKHDFIALEIVDEQVQLTFSAGRPPRGRGGSPAGARQVKTTPTPRGTLRRARGSSPGPRPPGKPGTCKGVCRAWKARAAARRAGPGDSPRRGAPEDPELSWGLAVGEARVADGQRAARAPRPLTSAFSRASAHR